MGLADTDETDGHLDAGFNFSLKFKEKMVGVARIELATPAMSTQCSTTELHAHGDGP